MLLKKVDFNRMQIKLISVRQRTKLYSIICTHRTSLDDCWNFYSLFSIRCLSFTESLKKKNFSGFHIRIKHIRNIEKCR